MPDPRPRGLTDLELARHDICERCDGSGTVRRPHVRDHVPCPDCGGKGVVPGLFPIVDVGEVERG